MKKILPIMFSLFIASSTVAQVTETFETQIDNAISFVSNGRTFNLGGVFHIEHLQDYGLGPSNYYIDNSNSCGTSGITGIISTGDGNNVFLNSIWMFVSSNCEFAGSGNILVSWYRNGNLVSFMSYPVISVITINNGFINLDFDADGQGLVEADEWHFQAPTSLNYIAIDNFKWTDVALQISDVNFQSSITFYPNPVTELLNINFNQEYESVNAKVINVIGQTLYEETIVFSNKLKLRIAEPTGLYFIELRNNKGEKTVLKIFKT